jgi:hypothetical protein
LHGLARSASAASITHTLTAVVTHDRPRTGPTLPRSRTCKGERYSTDPPASFAEDDARACRLVSTVHVTASRAVRAPPLRPHMSLQGLSRSASSPFVMHDPCQARPRAQRERPPSSCMIPARHGLVRSASSASHARPREQRERRLRSARPRAYIRGPSGRPALRATQAPVLHAPAARDSTGPHASPRRPTCWPAASSPQIVLAAHRLVMHGIASAAIASSITHGVTSVANAAALTGRASHALLRRGPR